MVSVNQSNGVISLRRKFSYESAAQLSLAVGYEVHLKKLILSLCILKIIKRKEAALKHLMHCRQLL